MPLIRMLIVTLSMVIHPISQAADDFEATEGRIKAAMAGSVRTEADTARDRNRKPVETLEFFGLRHDMKVLELVPGGGWYTKILAPTLADDGELHLAIGAERLSDSLLKEPGFDKVKVIAVDRNAPIDFGDTDYDLVLTFRNLHNFDEAGRENINRAAYAALKPGGVYGVVDHTRRHMERDAPHNGRRVDPVLAIKEIQAIGFEFEDYSTLHYRADDELRFEVGVRSVSGNTDRFTMRFRKPQ